MTWPDFYQHYDEWAESTQLKKISSLENIGPASEVADTTYLLVAHNGISRFIQSYFHDMTNEEFARFGVKNAAVYEFDF